jgi:hypothetical protein
MIDIVDRLRQDKSPCRDLGSTTRNYLHDEAADEIERLRQALRYIANDYVELSHDKVRWQRDDHMKMAGKALAESYKNEELEEPKPLNDDF